MDWLKNTPMKPLLLILALALTVSAQAKRIGIDTEYDRFTDTTTIRNSQSIMPVRPGFVLFETVAHIKGKYTPGVTPTEVALRVESYSDRWVFLGQTNALRVLYNGSERYSLGTMRRIDAEVTERGVIEVLYLEVSMEAIEKLASAEKLEIQIGPLESEIKPEQRASIRKWLALFREKPRPVSSPLLRTSLTPCL